jgi:hypothetical protein
VSELIELRLLNEQLIMLRAMLWSILNPTQSHAAIRDEMRAQAELFRQQAAPNTAAIVTMDRCDGVPEDKCGLLDSDAWIDIGGFGDPNKRQCRGCGYQERRGNYASQ